MEVSGRKPKSDGSKTTADDFSLFCHPCDGEGKRVAAHGYCKNCSEYLCDACYKFHTKPTPCKHHVLVDMANMPQQPASSEKGTTSAVKCTKVCPNHADKVVEVYCVTHGTAVCGLCAFRNHKTCKVEDILDKAKNYKSSQEYADLKDNIDQIESDVDLCLGDAENNLKDNEKCIGKVIEEVRKYKAEVNAYLQKKEGELLVQAKKMKSEDEDTLKLVRADCQVVKSDITQLKTALTKQEDKGGDLFVEAKQAMTLVEDLKERLAKCKIKNKTSDYSFQPDQALKTILTSQCPLGKFHKADKIQEIRIPTKMTPQLKPFDFASSKISKLPDMIKSTQAKGDCWITGATLLSPNALLVVDYNNMSVRSIDTVNNIVTSCLQLSSKPWDITVLPQQQAAITTPNANQIQVISTTGKLLHLRSITVKGQCRGICSTDDKFIVSYVFPGKVEVTNHHGGVLHTINSDVHGQPLFKSPWYVTVSSEGNNETMIYVSDNDTHSITKMNLEGKVIFVYRDKNLSQPRGLTVSQDGQILIINSGNNNIHVVSPEAKKTGTLLDKLYSPYSVSYCPAECKLYVSCYYLFGGPTIKNNIRVFKLN